MLNWFVKNAWTIHRIFSPVFNIGALIRSVNSIIRYPTFIYNYIRYRAASDELVPLGDLYPCLFDLGSTSQSGRGHYFYQDIWALSRIVENLPVKHIDVGSRIDGFSGQLSAFCAVEYIDIRAVDLGLDNLKMTEGSLLNLPFSNFTIPSLSCLHVIEHIGLGRYGDELNVHGSQMAAKELVRVLSPGGRLLVGIPIGRERVSFNAHRVVSPHTVLNWFSELSLVEFSAVNDKGRFVRNAKINDFLDQDYACGLFQFERPA
jgi:hypothetical protein